MPAHGHNVAHRHGPRRRARSDQARDSGESQIPADQSCARDGPWFLYLDSDPASRARSRPVNRP
jgi:hypothetical protein